MCLLATHDRKLAWTGPAGDAPGVSCKRKDILRLTLYEYLTWADRAAEGFDWAAEFLAQEGVFTASDVPYRTQIVPLAAIRSTLGDEIDNHGHDHAYPSVVLVRSSRRTLRRGDRDSVRSRSGAGRGMDRSRRRRTGHGDSCEFQFIALADLAHAQLSSIQRTLRNS